MVEPPANRGSGLRDHLGPRTSLAGAGVLVVEVLVLVVVEVAIQLLVCGESTAR